MLTHFHICFFFVALKLNAQHNYFSWTHQESYLSLNWTCQNRTQNDIRHLTFVLFTYVRTYFTSSVCFMNRISLKRKWENKENITEKNEERKKTLSQIHYRVCWALFFLVENSVGWGWFSCAVKHIFRLLGMKIKCCWNTLAVLSIYNTKYRMPNAKNNRRNTFFIFYDCHFHIIFTEWCLFISSLHSKMANAE